MDSQITGLMPVASGGARPPVVAITSGKGGVGKSSLVANVASLLATEHRVLAIDADYGLANLAVMLDVTPRRTLQDAFEGRCSLSEVFVEARPGLTLVPGGSGVRRLSGLSHSATRAMLDRTAAVADGFDLVLIDTAAGIAPSVLATLEWADRVLVVLGDDPASFVDAYATVKLLLEARPEQTIDVVVNGVRSKKQGAQLHANFALVTRRFLGRAPEMLGTVPRDARLGDAVRHQRLVTSDQPTAPSSRALVEIAERLRDEVLCTKASLHALQRGA